MVKKVIKRKINRLEIISNKLTNWVGTSQSILAHTIFFVVIFALRFFGVTFDSILLILTTAVSLEAIYLAIFIQMTVNKNTQSLASVEEDIDDIQEDVEDIQEEVEDLGEDVEEISQEFDEMQEEEKQEEEDEEKVAQTLDSIEKQLKLLLEEVDSLKKSNLDKSKSYELRVKRPPSK
jgi:septal ring factor EnvC (AmiA/AmiB activator)